MEQNKDINQRKSLKIPREVMSGVKPSSFRGDNEKESKRVDRVDIR